MTSTLADLLARCLPVANGCLEWPMGDAQGPYPQVRFRGRCESAHRAVWKAAHGDPPATLCVLRSCGNRRCVSLLHLYLGSREEVSRDAIERGTIPTGARCPHAALTAAQVAEIRRRRKDTDRRSPSTPTLAALAHEYGVHLGTVANVVHARTYQE